MEKLNEIMSSHGSYQQLRESERQGAEQSRPSTAHPIWELWSILTEFYGAAFTAQYGDEPNATWAFTLRDLTPDDYRKGIDLLRERESSFAPNPAEFVQMICSDAAWERQCHKPVGEVLGIENKRHLSKESKAAFDDFKSFRSELGL